MPRLPGCLFKFIQKQPPDTTGVHSTQSQLATTISDWCVKKTEKVQKCLTKFRRKTPIVLESSFQILLKKRLWHLFFCEFCEICKNNFLTEPEHLFSCNLGDCCFFLILLIFLWPSFLLFVASYRYLILCESALQLKTNFYDSCSYLSSLLFLLPKTEFVFSFAFVLCSVLLFSISAD